MLKLRKLVSDKHTIFMFLAILLIGIGLRIFRIDYQSFWNDELLTVKNIGVSFVQLITQPRDPNIMPLFYFFIHPLKGLENQEFWLRVPPMVFGCLAIIVVYFICKNYFGKRAGIIGALLVAISPFHIWYSQEARPYTLLITLSLLSILFLQYILRNADQHLLKLPFVVVTTAIFYSHPVGIALLGFEAVYLVLFERKRWKEWVLVFGGIGLLMVPGLYRMLNTPPMSANTYYSFNPLSLVYSLWAFETGYSLGLTSIELHMPNRVHEVISNLPIIAPIMMFYTVLLIMGVVKMYRQSNPLFWFTILWLIFPLAFAVFGSVWTVHPFNVRYAILSFPPFITILTVGILSFKKKWQQMSLIILIGIVSLSALHNYYFDEKYQRENNRAAGRFLTMHAKQSDLVIASAGYTAKNLRYYYNGENAIRIMGYPSNMKGNSDSSSKIFGAKFVIPERLELDFKMILKEKSRFWLFLSRAFHSDPDGRILAFCEKRFRRELHSKWNDSELILYHVK